MSKKGTYASSTEKLLSFFSTDINEKNRIFAINALMFLSVLCSWIGNTIVEFYSMIFYMISCGTPFLIAFFLNDGRYSRVNCNRYFGILFCCYVTTFLAGAVMTARLGSIALGLTCLIAFPLIAKVTSSDCGKRKLLLESLMNALISNFCIIIIVSIVIIDPGEQRQYSGIMLNPNTLGLLSVCALIGFIYKIHKTGSIIHYAGCGTAVAIMFFTQSRTALIGTGILIIIVAFYIIKNKIYLQFSAVGLIAMIASGIILFGMIFYVSPISDGVHSYVFENLLKEETKESMREVDMGDRDFDRLTESIGGDSDFTTGRMAIWEAYIEGIRFTPNGDDVMPVVNGEELTISAHNTYIHLAYCFGMLCGISYLLFNICVGIMSLQSLYRKKDFISVLNLIVVLNYGIVTLVETSYNFATYVICFMYWIFIFGIMGPGTGKERENG